VTFDGAIWFATAGQGASRYDGSSWTVFRTSEGLTYNTKDTAIADDGAIWFSSDGYGIFRYNGSSFQNWTMKDGLPSDWVDIITVGPDGSIWAGFKNEGIGRFGN
jgi:ligand-binding sensor domain-containing protein